MPKDKVATEGFVKTEIKVIRTDIDRLDRSIGRMEQNLDEKFSKVMEYLVDIAGKFQKFDEEQ